MNFYRQRCRIRKADLLQANASRFLPLTKLKVLKVRVRKMIRDTVSSNPPGLNSNTYSVLLHQKIMQTANTRHPISKQSY